jgi:hypothetical protein
MRTHPNRPSARVWIAGFFTWAVACTTPAPPVDLPPLSGVSAIAVDPGCSASSCPPERVVRDPAEIAFRLALLHALNKDWEVADDSLCPTGGRSGRSTYLDADDRPILVVWEHRSPGGVQVAFRGPETGCQATPRWSPAEYGSAMEAARRLYGPMLEQAGDRDR